MGQRIDDCLLMCEADTAGLWLHEVDASRRYLGSECILRFRLLWADYRRRAVEAAGGGTDRGFKPEPEGGSHQRIPRLAKRDRSRFTVKPDEGLAVQRQGSSDCNRDPDRRENRRAPYIFGPQMLTTLIPRS